MRDTAAAAVVRILFGADGNCPNCAEALLEEFVLAFPQHLAMARAMYEQEFGRAPYNADDWAAMIAQSPSLAVR